MTSMDNLILKHPLESVTVGPDGRDAAIGWLLQVACDLKDDLND